MVAKKGIFIRTFRVTVHTLRVRIRFGILFFYAEVLSDRKYRNAKSLRTLIAPRTAYASFLKISHA